MVCCRLFYMEIVFINNIINNLYPYLKIVKMRLICRQKATLENMEDGESIKIRLLAMLEEKCRILL
jgi:hypothetical protein